jgi:hypothetical protein
MRCYICTESTIIAGYKVRYMGIGVPVLQTLSPLNSFDVTHTALINAIHKIMPGRVHTVSTNYFILVEPSSNNVIACAQITSITNMEIKIDDFWIERSGRSHDTDSILLYCISKYMGPGPVRLASCYLPCYLKGINDLHTMRLAIESYMNGTLVSRAKL